METNGFNVGQLAIIEKTARVTAKEVVDLHAAVFREQARASAMEVAASSAKAVESATQVLAKDTLFEAEKRAREIVDNGLAAHGRTCGYKAEIESQVQRVRGEVASAQISMWKLIALALASGTVGGGVLKLLGG